MGTKTNLSLQAVICYGLVFFASSEYTSVQLAEGLVAGPDFPYPPDSLPRPFVISVLQQHSSQRRKFDQQENVKGVCTLSGERTVYP